MSGRAFTYDTPPTGWEAAYTERRYAATPIGTAYLQASNDGQELYAA